MTDQYNDIIMMDFRELCEAKSDELRFFLDEPEKLGFEQL